MQVHEFRNNWLVCAKTNNFSLLLLDEYNMRLLPYRHVLGDQLILSPCAIHKKCTRVMGYCLVGAAPAEWTWPTWSQLFCKYVHTHHFAEFQFPGTAGAGAVAWRSCAWERGDSSWYKGEWPSLWQWPGHGLRDQAGLTTSAEVSWCKRSVYCLLKGLEGRVSVI